ncbi:saccharopine dehydrogenase NADP-binding domain-containing protein [candidate division WOR-3 bacterium]|nr:saccharopine dehydrogenase NADP-binding domain-containing protein [candidate division WOR-3 bacterium]
MKKVLVFGAGMVARPLVRYLLEQPDFNVKVATRTVSKAEKIISNHPRGEPKKFDITTDALELEPLISDADLVISLLPYTYHVEVAKLCIKHKKQMVTTSYVSDAMQELNNKAKEAGILILNEIGLDPGIDHMSAMKIIDKVHNDGGIVTSFHSYCGALPSPKANVNPFGYKFSWSPKGVVLAGRNEAKYLKDGKEVFIPGEELFENYSIVTIDEIGEFEVYPNRNSLGYIEKYKLPNVKTMFRGTLRYIGWCETWKKIAELGLLDSEEHNIKGLSYKDWLKTLLPETGDDIKKSVALYLKLDEYSAIIKRLEWLGLFSEEPISIERGSALDVLTTQLLEKLKYKEGERDMIALQHRFIIDYPSSHKNEKIIATLINYGEPDGDTAVARTVGLPAAIGAKLILEGKIKLTGVHIPTAPAIYEPVLKELENQGIIFSEKKIR